MFKLAQKVGGVGDPDCVDSFASGIMGKMQGRIESLERSFAVLHDCWKRDVSSWLHVQKYGLSRRAEFLFPTGTSSKG